MALIKCPECERENVSDSTEFCPDHAYDTKMYFDEIKQKELGGNK
ncbi:hypothetical protein [Kineothrix alysoides]|nr:hypothetical protein [Kineothrix alysoides]